MKTRRILSILMLCMLAIGCRQSQHAANETAKMDFERDETWVLTAMRQKEVNYDDDQEKVTIQFNPETRNFSGFSGCNRFYGDYVYKQESEYQGELKLSHIGSTMMMCPDAIMKLEDTFLPLLGKTTHCVITAYRLKLMQGTKVLLEFEKL